MGADVNLQNYDGDTPLHLAARYEMEYIVKLLLHYNADVNITNEKDETAVDLTRINRYPHIQVLLQDNKNKNLKFVGRLSLKDNEISK